VLTQLQVKRQI